MSTADAEYMKIAIQFAKEKNPIWPFAAIIVNQQGEVICKATDCAHISPIFHAETLAIHTLITLKKTNKFRRIIALYNCRTRCDVTERYSLGQSRA